MIWGDIHAKKRVRFANQTLELRNPSLRLPQHQESSVIEVRGGWGGSHEDCRGAHPLHARRHHSGREGCRRRPAPPPLRAWAWVNRVVERLRAISLSCQKHRYCMAPVAGNFLKSKNNTRVSAIRCEPLDLSRNPTDYTCVAQEHAWATVSSNCCSQPHAQPPRRRPPRCAIETHRGCQFAAYLVQSSETRHSMPADVMYARGLVT